MANNRNGYNSYNGYNGRNGGRNSREVEFRIIEHLGVLDSYTSDWNKEVNIVIWNDNQPRVDIRDWDPAHEKMSRGITLMGMEAENLGKILSERFPCRREYDSVPYLRESSVFAQYESDQGMKRETSEEISEESRDKSMAEQRVAERPETGTRSDQPVPDAGELYRDDTRLQAPREYIVAAEKQPEEEPEAACL
ncbi:MAG: hypothetical protein IJH90_02670 [Mogibacterium sp.]|nr:hypothetical protein [Mogibacterium sp.]